MNLFFFKSFVLGGILYCSYYLEMFGYVMYGVLGSFCVLYYGIVLMKEFWILI